LSLFFPYLVNGYVFVTLQHGTVMRLRDKVNRMKDETSRPLPSSFIIRG
jgi:hypothetical protein